MKSKLVELISEYPFYLGCIFIVIGVYFLIYKILKKESFDMDNYNVAGWGALISSWALIILSFIFGFFLILK
jgi:xanthine/uracil permease